MTPEVSIIVPVYNAEATLARCVDSILAQTFRDMEVLLVDDGSKDASGRMCDEYAQKHANVYAVHRENGGDSAARNTALAIARGRYVQHVDSDDWLEPYATEKLVNAMRESGAGLAVCSFNNVINGEKRPVKLGIEGLQPPQRQLMEFAYGLPDALLRVGASWNKLYRREIIAAHSLRFEEIRRANEDALFNFAYIKHIENVFFIDEPLYNYAVPDGRGTVTTAYRPQAFEMNERIYDSIETAVGDKLSERERRVLNRHYIDKTLIVMKMLGRENEVFTEAELREKLRSITDHAKVRQALSNLHPEGTQENEAIELLRRRDYDALIQYAKEGAKRLYGNR